MALGVDYDQQDCSLARALELVGERWTMLILRDCFFGVRRFSDFEVHLDISKAVLSQRLTRLVDAGILDRTPRGGRDEYALTEGGIGLWPALYALTRWGEQQSGSADHRRLFSHAACGTDLSPTGQCVACGVAPLPDDIDMRPGPTISRRRTDPIAEALRRPRRLLDPIRF